MKQMTNTISRLLGTSLVVIQELVMIGLLRALELWIHTQCRLFQLLISRMGKLALRFISRKTLLDQQALLIRIFLLVLGTKQS